MLLYLLKEDGQNEFLPDRTLQLICVERDNGTGCTEDEMDLFGECSYGLDGTNVGFSFICLRCNQEMEETKARKVELVQAN